jgi:hypothetical protein
MGSGPRLYTESHVAADGYREWSQERKLDRSRMELAERVTREYTGRAAVAAATVNSEVYTL